MNAKGRAVMPKYAHSDGARLFKIEHLAQGRLRARRLPPPKRGIARNLKRSRLAIEKRIGILRKKRALF
jgi:hypothetical protein